MSEDAGLFGLAEVRPDSTLAFVAACHLCGAVSEPISHADTTSTGERWNDGAPWTGVLWASLTLKQHEAECPGRDAPTEV